jgi:regulator of protease activity HflC (stomatin/prohibitin superfamily)
LLVTGDGQLLELAGAIQYHLSDRPDDLRRYAFAAAAPEAALRPLAESAIRAVVARCRLEDVLTSRRALTELASAALLQERTAKYRLGLVISAVTFQDVHPPLAVVDAFRDISRAESERQRRQNEAQAYRGERLARAQGLSAATLHAAEAERQTRLAKAAGEADAFLLRHQARATHPNLTDHRLYWESLSITMAGKAKIILDPDRTTRRHIILRDFPLEESKR